MSDEMVPAALTPVGLPILVLCFVIEEEEMTGLVLEYAR